MKSRTCAVLALSGFALAGGCDPADETRALAVRAADDGPPQAPPRRGRLVAGERVARTIAWPTPGAAGQAARALLRPSLLAEVDAAPVPVLLPRDPLWLDAPHFTAPRDPSGKGPGFGYAFAARRPGAALTIQGSRVATLLPGVGRAEGRTPLRGVTGFVTDNDGIKSASWIEHGVAYTLEVECAPPDAPACAEAAVRAAVEDLVFVGGAGEGGAR